MFKFEISVVVQLGFCFQISLSTTCPIVQLLVFLALSDFFLVVSSVDLILTAGIMVQINDNSKNSCS